ncbi:mitotic checkpoint regulator, MAD2B-interacting-domain-containing protein [Hypoxylon sp. FL0543]|nr:mitotic checkpoint regulator, MAD2B-interacting-domain-containing protein [Hypoxylon sp. FL0543]
MGLVDYSDSESDSETLTKPAPAPPAPTSTAGSKKAFQKVVDRAKPGKILVHLPQSSSGRDVSNTAEGSDEPPPPKRAKVTGRGGGAFSGFNALLPPPKNIGKPAVASSSGKPTPRPGINLKTGAAPGFSRETNGEGDGGANDTATGSEDAEPQAKQPSIPAEQKPAEEVKLVGKPLMFKPLSVSRKPGKKAAAKSAAKPKAATTPAPAPQQATSQASEAPQAKGAEKEAGPPPKKQKISLFSISDDPAGETQDDAPSSNGLYEPMFGTEDSATDEFAAYDAQYATTIPSSSSNTAAPPAATTHATTNAESLDAIAASMNLSAAARRELFGRSGDASALSSSRIVNFDTDREYAHNEMLRASGQLQPTYNPVRAIAPGKHNLRQLVNQVQNQRDALEESFAKGKSNRNEAGSKYGWR